MDQICLSFQNGLVLSVAVHSKRSPRKTRAKTGRKGPDLGLVELVIEIIKRNPRFGYGRIAM